MEFMNQWNNLKQNEHYGSFNFNGKADDWNLTVKSHFKAISFKKPYYGVYVISQKSSSKIIYIGKSGKMYQNGLFTKQEIPGRLTNQENNQMRKYYFEKKVVEYGELNIEYIVLKSKSLIPGYLEALLLQAYYNEHNELPIDNKLF